MQDDVRRTAVQVGAQEVLRGAGAMKGARGDMQGPDGTEPNAAPRRDKQLQGVTLESVLEKRRLDQALNAKEFAVCAGVSYSTARCWFHLPAFPAFRGVVFWQDFVQWRADQTGFKTHSLPTPSRETIAAASNLPRRAAQILHDA